MSAVLGSQSNVEDVILTSGQLSFPFASNARPVLSQHFIPMDHADTEALTNKQVDTRVRWWLKQIATSA